MANQTSIYTLIQINKPIREVFDYATTPANWPRWHPASLSVTGATDHSLELGEQVTETISVAGRRGLAVWTVQARELPYRWVIKGEVKGGGSGTITYRLTPYPSGVTFERELFYSLPNPFWVILDRLFIRHFMRAQSTEALRRLKQVLESR